MAVSETGVSDMQWELDPFTFLGCGNIADLSAVYRCIESASRLLSPDSVPPGGEMRGKYEKKTFVYL